MGFRMSKTFVAARQDGWMWLSLHTIMCLLALTLLLSATGCDWTEVEEKPPQVGKEFSVNDVVRAYENALSGITVATVQVGDSARYEYNYRVESGLPKKIWDLSTVVNDRIVIPGEGGDNIRLVFKDQLVEYDDQGNPDVTISDRVVDTFQPTPNSVTDLLNTLLSPFAENEEDVKETFHDLRVRRFKVAVPQIHPDCQRFTDCKINVTEIRYDIVTRAPGKKLKKVELLHQVSRDVPWLAFTDSPIMASTILRCHNGLMDIGERDYFINQCLILRDFQTSAP